MSLVRTMLVRVAAPAVLAAAAAFPVSATAAVPPVAASQIKRDSMTVTIEPAKRIEVKLVMKKGAKADYQWSTNGAEVGYNLHAEVPTDPSVKAVSYQRGSSKGEKGTIEAVFDGVHGWSWRNTGDAPVTITVRASGQFSELKKM